MTREELFSVFPRPWRQLAGGDGIIVDAKDRIVLEVDPNCRVEDEDAMGAVELILELVNGAEE